MSYVRLLFFTMCPWKESVRSPTFLAVPTEFLSNLQLETPPFKVCLKKKQTKIESKTYSLLSFAASCLPFMSHCHCRHPGNSTTSPTPVNLFFRFLSRNVGRLVAQSWWSKSNSSEVGFVLWHLNPIVWYVEPELIG